MVHAIRTARVEDCEAFTTPLFLTRNKKDRFSGKKPISRGEEPYLVGVLLLLTNDSRMTKQQVEKFLETAGESINIHIGWTFMSRTKASITLGEDALQAPLLAPIPYKSILAMTDKPMRSLSSSVTFGSDPEFFFKRDGEVVPSTEVIVGEVHGVARDGFQGELQPGSSSCREIAGGNLANALLRAKDCADQVGAEVSLSVGEVIGEKVWRSVTPDVKRFGCHPTTSVYEKKFRRATGLRERFRSGAGHVHIGGLGEEDRRDADTIVKLMDIVCGNTCVLIDRDEDNARRRKVYGRAGEYRIKPYGIEYRVPSNFWVRHYILWSMVSGLLRNAVSIYRSGLTDDLIGRFDMKQVRDDINNNDKELAMKNFLIYLEFLKEHGIFFGSGIDIGNADRFLVWAEKDSPIDEVVGGMEDTYNSWVEKITVGAKGFERFLDSNYDQDEVMDSFREDYGEEYDDDDDDY